MNISIDKRKGDLSLYYVFNNGRILINDGLKIRDKIEILMKNQEFSGEKFQISYLNNIEKDQKILFVGLGDAAEYDQETLRKATSKAIRYCSSKKIKSISIDFNKDEEGKIISTVYVIGESAVLTDYKYDKYLSKKIERNVKNIYINVLGDKEIQRALEEGIIIGKSTNIARDLVNEPANIQIPEKMGKDVKLLGKEYGFEVELFNEKEIIEMGMDAFYEVSKGSINKPVLIVMRYNGNEYSEEKIGLIGKGVTFDTGGINLKRGPRFINMKHDMVGAAAVIGAMCSIAKGKLKANVVGVVASCENMISSKAYKPGDIINSMAGKSILINSTDAEGRLTLIDAIHYAIEKENIDKVVNIASLTGSARKILGHYGGIVMSNNEDFYNKLEDASKDSGEFILRLPIIKEARKHLKSEIADYINSSDLGTCGAITAGMFIGEFVQDKDWIHLDMSGPCWSYNEKFYNTHGGTGWGTKLLYNLVKKTL